MKKYSALGIANKRFNPEFEQWKGKIFDFVKGNFEPSYKDDTIDDSTFFIDKTKWIVRYDHGIKCWLLFIDGKVLINKYDEVSEFFIEAEGYVKKWYPHSIMDEDFIKVLHEKQSLLLSELMTVKIKQENGTRKISYPKEKMHGRISRKDYYSGMDDWQRQNYWALKFSTHDIKYIDKEPVTAPLTLREYFRLCRLYYLANPHDFKDVLDDPKESCLQFADGRTEQMKEVELDDSQDFYDWAKKQGRWAGRSVGGHPYEISAKTYIFPRFTDGLNGHYVWRSFIWRYHEAVTLCREPNLILSDKEYLIEIIKGNGMLEVTPSLYRYGYANSEYDEPVRYGDMTKKQKSKIVSDELTEAKIKRRANGDKV